MFGSVSGVFVQAVTFGMVDCLRYLPSWTTIGMFAPAGTFVSVK
jgi:uncharacterized membrane protein